MRVRNSPFGGSGGAGAAGGNGFISSSGGGFGGGSGGGFDGDDWFSNAGISSAPAPPPAQFSAVQPPVASAGVQPPMPGAGVLPPRPGMGVQPPSMAAQGFPQPPQPQPQQQQQQPQGLFPQPVAHQQQPQPQMQQQQQQAFQQQGSFPSAPAPAAPSSFEQQGQQMLQQGVAAGMGAMGLNPALAGLVANQVPLDQLSVAARWFPNVFVSLQALFNVGHAFVLRKLLMLLCPFLKRKQAAAPDQGAGWSVDASPSNTGASTLGPDGLKIQPEEPDLYIPLMAYVTYVLAYGIQRGTLSDFKPEVLTSTASFAMVMLFLEVGIAKVAFYVAGGQASVLEITACSGYKFLHVMLLVFLRIATTNSYVYYAVFVYLAACAAFAARCSLLFLLQQAAMRQQYGISTSALQGHIVLALAAAQVPVLWLLTPWSAK
eukprot:TRINITY_DN4178_c0_g1_i2.p1 TRINITY_DN4178_c0_g1~~TRINITY_DN4178_c0_g1_i2.p1  ORF type:complete len:431 (+),score=127.60 TRINITY_DN4178_c0_g1_i2:67-1359(+)